MPPDLDRIELEAPIFDPVAFRLTEAQASLIEQTQRLAAAKFAPRAAAYDREARFPTENYQDLRDAGLLAICVPQAHGGLGADCQTYSLATIQMPRQHPVWQVTDASSLRAMTTGSSIVSQELIDAFAGRSVPVLQVLWFDGNLPDCDLHTPPGDLTRPGSTGLPGLSCEARIVDADGNDVPPNMPGEILIRGDNVLTEYRGNKAAMAGGLRDGWYWTGDIAQCDTDGYVSALEGKRNLIISGGENSFPAEIECVLHQHAALLQAAAIGASDPRWEEVPLAFVMLHAGATTTTEEPHARPAAHRAVRASAAYRHYAGASAQRSG